MGSGVTPSGSVSAVLGAEPPATGSRRTPADSGAKTHDDRLAQLLREHFRAVWRAVRRFGVTEDVADDAAQEVFIVAARKLDTIEPGGERRFLYGVALRVAANARRARLGRREHGDEEALLSAVSSAPRADTLLEAKRLRELLDVLLDELSDDLREVFVLFELEGFSTREISDLLEIPIGTAASRLRRAREAFQAAAQRVQKTLGHVPTDGEP